MFHGIESDEFRLRQNDADKFYTIKSGNFRDILTCVKNNKQTTVTTREFGDIDKIDKAVCITFDDGLASDHVLAMSILNEYNMQAVFFIVTDWIGKKNYLTEQQLMEMHSYGMDIQIHGKTHDFLTKLSKQEILSQLRHAKQYTEDLLSKNINSISFPGGRGDNRVIKIARETDFKYFFSSRPGWCNFKTEDIPRYVVHQKTPLPEAKAYLSAETGMMLKKVIKYNLSRYLYSWFGEELYNRIKLGSK